MTDAHLVHDTIRDILAQAEKVDVTVDTIDLIYPGRFGFSWREGRGAIKGTATMQEFLRALVDRKP